MKIKPDELVGWRFALRIPGRTELLGVKSIRFNPEMRAVEVRVAAKKDPKDTLLSKLPVVGALDVVTLSAENGERPFYRIEYGEAPTSFPGEFDATLDETAMEVVLIRGFRTKDLRLS